jgi:1-pyrroline-5-carboxylate dehydrogenase
MAWEQRAAIFLKAAELIAGPQSKNKRRNNDWQSKNVHQQKLMLHELIDFYVLNES